MLLKKNRVVDHSQVQQKAPFGYKRSAFKLYWDHQKPVGSDNWKQKLQTIWKVEKSSHENNILPCTLGLQILAMRKYWHHLVKHLRFADYFRVLFSPWKTSWLLKSTFESLRALSDYTDWTTKPEWPNKFNFVEKDC